MPPLPVAGIPCEFDFICSIATTPARDGKAWPDPRPEPDALDSSPPRRLHCRRNFNFSAMTQFKQLVLVVVVLVVSDAP